jgi:hypothetical protein
MLKCPILLYIREPYGYHHNDRFKYILLKLWGKNRIESLDIGSIKKRRGGCVVEGGGVSVGGERAVKVWDNFG